ncbi:MAG: hypothetical protein FWG74_06910, partial [Planctomycetes bacterium]|nr:hypothetical protein [Planctomycetota bacterium]
MVQAMPPIFIIGLALLWSFIPKPFENSVSRSYCRQCARRLQDQKTEFLAHSGIQENGLTAARFPV